MDWQFLVERLIEERGSRLVAYGGMLSVALRMSGLPDGETFTVTSAYGNPDTALAACVVPWSTPSASAAPTGAPSGTPSSEPGVSQGPGPEPLSGPESSVFACGMPLLADLEGNFGLDVTWESGVRSYSFVSGSSEFLADFGAGGVAIDGSLARGAAPGDKPNYPGWAWSHTDTESLAVFDAVVAVQDGLIVGVVPADETGADGVTPEDTYNFLGEETAGAPTSLLLTASDVDARMHVCAGMDASRLEVAQTVVLLGTGAAGGPYQFAWTSVAR